jgi:ribosomal RNA-processing protein 36
VLSILRSPEGRAHFVHGMSSDSEESVGDVALGEVLRSRMDGSTGREGSLVRHRALKRSRRPDVDDDDGPARPHPLRAVPDARKDSKAPAEVTSKKRVSGFRQIVATKSAETRDPRFDPVLGKALEPRQFMSKYGFLVEEHLPADIAALRKTLKRTKGFEKKRQLQAELTKLQQQKSSVAFQLGEAEVASRTRKAQRSAAEAGHRPYFLKRREMKELVQAERFQQLRESGGERAVDRALKKKRERNARKDRRKLSRGPPASGGADSAAKRVKRS